jgi:hypothetical protein
MKKILLTACMAALVFCLGATAQAAGRAKSGGLKTTVKASYTVMNMKASNEYAKINVDYPKFGAALIDKRINEVVQDEINTFMKDADARYAEDKGAYEYELDATFNIEALTDNLLSIRFEGHSDFAGTHPASWLRTLVLLRKTGETVTLKELFKPDTDYLNVISDLAIQKLTAKLKNPDEKLLRLNIGPDAENFKNFAVTGYTVRFFFDQNKFGGMTGDEMETQTVDLPFYKVDQIVRQKILFLMDFVE